VKELCLALREERRDEIVFTDYYSICISLAHMLGRKSRRDMYAPGSSDNWRGSGGQAEYEKPMGLSRLARSPCVRQRPRGSVFQLLSFLTAT
jgi:hypothetical protein